MPLSDHEQRLLEQMERALYAEDPKFATSMRHARPAAGDKRRVALGVLAVLAGLGMLVAGVATQFVVVGVAGFLAMLGGIWLVVVAMRPSEQAAAQPGNGRPTVQRGRPTRPTRSSGGGSGSLTERMEERWRRRRETGDF